MNPSECSRQVKSSKSIRKQNKNANDLAERSARYSPKIPAMAKWRSPKEKIECVTRGHVLDPEIRGALMRTNSFGSLSVVERICLCGRKQYEDLITR